MKMMALFPFASLKDIANILLVPIIVLAAWIIIHCRLQLVLKGKTCGKRLSGDRSGRRAGGGNAGNLRTSKREGTSKRISGRIPKNRTRGAGTETQSSTKEM
jgi:hypothetical protein